MGQRSALAVLAIAPLVLLTSAAALDGQETGDEATRVVQRVLQAYGGVEVVRSVEGFRREGILVALNGGAHGRQVLISAGLDRLSVMIEYPARTELRIMDGQTGWRGSRPESLDPVEGPLLAAMILQAARSRLPRTLDDLRGSTRLVAEKPDGVTVLEVRIAPTLLLRVFVDDETWLIVRSESVLQGGPGRIGFASVYSEHRQVAGTVFPFHEETYASGVHTASISVESVELNPRGARARLPLPRR